MSPEISITFILFIGLASCGKLYFSPRNQVRCEDGITKCPIDHTCCTNSQNDFGCCAFANATCCDNGLHCCPPGFHCSPEGCLKDKKFILPAKQSNEVQMLPKNVICPDKESYCNDGQTCCKISNGSFGCCPIPEAVCCLDNVHCCPSGSTCNPETSSCTRQDGLLIEWKKKMLAKKVEDILCPDKKSYCPSSTTCCLMPVGTYGCCPIPNAVCCDDHVHCCPTGYTCDSKRSACIKSSSAPSQEPSSTSYITWFKKTPAKTLDNDKTPAKTLDNDKTPAKTLDNDGVLCPNKTIFCDEGYTCCPIKNTQLEACCAFYKGVCCKDQLTCCPQGSVCSSPDYKDAPRCFYPGEERKIEAKEAIRATESVAMLNIVYTKIVPCDEAVYCQEKQTCCQNTATKQYMCCPYEHASCCGDGKTCCKSWCAPWINTCIPNSYKNTVDMWNGVVSKSDINPQAQRANWCNDGMTIYCTEGFVCNLNTESCMKVKPNEAIDNAKMDVLSRAALVAPTPKPLVLPQLEASALPHVCSKTPSYHGGRTCASGELCCSHAGGSNKCCPFSDGICCEGGDTCCPSGTQCLADGSCKSNAGNIFIFQNKLTPTSSNNKLSSSLPKDTHEVCPDKTMCPKDTTCCILLDAQYACCQFKSAMCCADKVHCCPQGYTCDIEGGMCKQSSLSTSWEMFTRKRAQKAVKSAPISNHCTHPSNALAPTHRCPVDYLCCYDHKDPFNSPVCCDQDSKCCDGFCCPNGYKCGTVKGRCVKEGI